MRKWWVSLALIGLFSLAAQAQDTPPPDSGGAKSARAACKQDAERLCQGVQPGGGRIVQCLQDHKDQLQPACASGIAKLHGHKPPAGSGDSDPSAPSKPQ
jgi:hypothetical protein